MDADSEANLKVMVYKVVTATTIVIPFDPANPTTVDATSGMSRTAEGLLVPFKECLEDLVSSGVGFAIEYDELTGVGANIEAGTTESHVISIEVLEKDDPEVQLVIDNSTIHPVQTSRTIN